MEDIRLPTTPSSAQALLVRVCGKTIAVATRGIEEIHFVTEEQLQRLGNRIAYRRDNELARTTSCNWKPCST